MDGYAINPPIFPFPAPIFVTELIDNPLRRDWLQKASVIAERMILKSDMILLEIGPGKGGFTKEIAEFVPQGTIYALDINPNLIERFNQRIGKKNIKNIIPMVGDVYNLKEFADESVDRIYSISAFPEIPDHVRALNEMKRVLKPDGRIVFSEIWIDPDLPLRKTEKKWATEAGLVLEEEYGHWYQYQLQFGKQK